MEMSPVKSKNLSFDVKDYPGGVSVWAGILPAYDTTSVKMNVGIHVHARQHRNQIKQIDGTYESLFLKIPNGKSLKITANLAKIYRNIKIFDTDFQTIAKLDRQISSLKIESWNEFFNDLEILKKQGIHQDKIVPSSKSLIINQKDYLGGLQIWGDAPSILWTSSAIHEESGIHIHAFDNHGKKIIDDTFYEVEIDGIKLNYQMLRFYTSQKSLDSLKSYIESLYCPKCGYQHFDDRLTLLPHSKHFCQKCGLNFTTKIPTIGNPIIETFEKLKSLN